MINLQVRIACTSLPADLLIQMDAAFLQEKHVSSRVQVAEHPSATVEVWRAALRRNADPKLLEAISGRPGAAKDPDVAAILPPRYG